jgi:hypothetical protein
MCIDETQVQLVRRVIRYFLQILILSAFIEMHDNVS